MAGIVFVRTTDLDRIVSFYTSRLGMVRWVSQPHIEILSHENFLVGFSQAEASDIDTLLTFFYPSRAEVDALHDRLDDVATGAPKRNERYRIYNFFGVDPDGRRFEVQAFLHKLPKVAGLPAST
jgi:catechol 2,3-dioxygenase-like lactoylglutathione lyase family enzyme